MRIKKLFKSSVILTAVVLIALISIAAVCSSSRSDEKLYASEEYMLSENLALNAITTDNDGSAIKSVTDGKSSTARIADRREGYYLTVDFGKTTEFNSVILKEDGLNVKSFVLYKSSDGVNFAKATPKPSFSDITGLLCCVT